MTPERYQIIRQSIEQHGAQGFEVELLAEIYRLTAERDSEREAVGAIEKIFAAQAADQREKRVTAYELELHKLGICPSCHGYGEHSLRESGGHGVMEPCLKCGGSGKIDSIATVATTIQAPAASI